MSLNMKKEIRRELGELKRAEKIIIRDSNKEIGALEKQRRQIGRQMTRVDLRAERSLAKINRRRLVLEGRLS